MPRSKAPNAIADAESDALVKLSEKDFWLVTELPSNIDADLLRCLDDRGLIESRFVVMQNQQKHGGDSTPSSRSPSAWFSPIQKPDMAGGWNEILSKREKNEWNHPFEVRISERGRAELARRRWAQEGSTEWQEANARPQRQPGQDDSSALRSMAAGLARLSDAIDELHETGVGPLDATLRPVRQRIIASAKALAGNTAAVRDAVQRQGMLTGPRKSDLADLAVSLAFISDTLRVSLANNYGFRMTSEMAPEQVVSEWNQHWRTIRHVASRLEHWAGAMESSRSSVTENQARSADLPATGADDAPTQGAVDPSDEGASSNQPPAGRNPKREPKSPTIPIYPSRAAEIFDMEKRTFLDAIDSGAYAAEWVSERKLRLDIDEVDRVDPDAAKRLDPTLKN